ncbi:MAG: hypothetical protein MJ076_02635 [Clostridia bacterium]|nr:hypothetical protein [Clostridia bacterium]
MNGLLCFVMAFCSVCVLMGGILSLSPDGAFEKPIKYVFALIFVCCIFSSLLAIGKIDFNIDVSGENGYVSEETVKAQAELLFSNALEKNNIEFTKITVCTDKLDDKSIIISKVIVYSSHSKEDIYEVLGQSDTYEVIVINGE